MERREGIRAWKGRFAELVRSLAPCSVEDASASLPKHRSGGSSGAVSACLRDEGQDGQAGTVCD